MLHGAGGGAGGLGEGAAKIPSQSREAEGSEGLALNSSSPGWYRKRAEARGGGTKGCPLLRGAEFREELPQTAGRLLESPV